MPGHKARRGGISLTCRLPVWATRRLAGSDTKCRRIPWFRRNALVMSSIDVEQLSPVTEAEEPPSTASYHFHLPVLTPSPPSEARRPELPPERSDASRLSRRFRSPPQSRAFLKRFFPQATAADWNDWRWQS